MDGHLDSNASHGCLGDLALQREAVQGLALHLISRCIAGICQLCADLHVSIISCTLATEWNPKSCSSLKIWFVLNLNKGNYFCKIWIADVPGSLENPKGCNDLEPVINLQNGWWSWPITTNNHVNQKLRNLRVHVMSGSYQDYGSIWWFEPRLTIRVRNNSQWAVVQ